MKHPVGPTRREVVRGIGAVLVVAATPGAWGEGSAARAAARTVAASFPDPRAAGAIGRAWLRAQRRPPSLAALLARLVATDPGWMAALRSPAAVRAYGAAAVRRDFLREAVTEVDGWLLARSEVLLCAITAAGTPVCTGRKNGDKGRR